MNLPDRPSLVRWKNLMNLFYTWGNWKRSFRVAFPMALLLSGCAGGSTSIPGDSLKSGLIHWWQFNGNAKDSAGTLSASPIGPVAYAYAPTGQAIVFNGSTTGISLPPVTDMQFQGSFSISAWASLYSYPSYGQLWATIIFDGDDRPGLDPYDLQVAPDGTFQFLTTSSTQALGINSPTTFPLNQFVFVTGTYDKVKGVQSLYMNGQLVAQNVNVPNLTPVVPLVANENAGIGIGTNNGFPVSEYNMGWNGAISDLRVYNRPLTENEVLTLYNRGLSGIP